MKSNALLFLFAFALLFSLIMSGCGQSQTSVPPPENNRASDASAIDAAASVDKPEANEPEEPEGFQPATTNTPTETDNSAEKSDASADASGEGAPNTVADASETNAPAPEESKSVSKPEQAIEIAPAPEPVTQEPAPTPESTPEPESVVPSASNTTLSGTTLTLQFGGGESFTINLYDNDTANKIAEYVGTAAWQLPIYHFDDYDGWESFQYYDIPRRYDIPDGSESVTSERAGMVYYSHPNRMILFYQDADISTEYTPVGYIDFSQDLVDAVENNPVVQGWGNKLIFIQP